MDPAIGAPGQAAAPVGLVVGARVGRQGPRHGALARLDRVDVPVVGAVRLVHALRDEGDGLSVGRPGRELLVVVAGGQDLGLASRDVQDREVIAELREVAVAVRLELVAIDDDRLLRLLLLRPSRRRLACPGPDRKRRGPGVCRPGTSRSPRRLPFPRSLSRPRRRCAEGARPGRRRCRRRGSRGRPGTCRPGSSAAWSRSPCSSSTARTPGRPTVSSRRPRCGGPP